MIMQAIEKTDVDSDSISSRHCIVKGYIKGYKDSEKHNHERLGGIILDAIEAYIKIKII